MAGMQAKTTRTDPLRNFKFTVNFVPLDDRLKQLVTGIGDLGFASMGGLAVNNEVIPYREGGMNTHTHKMIGLTDFPPVSFARGAFANQDALWKWQKFMHAWVSGGVGGFAEGSTGDDANYRCNIIVKIYDHPFTGQVQGGDTNYSYDSGDGGSQNIKPGNVKLAYKLFNAWPGTYALSDLNAGDNGIMVQSMVMHHEGFHVAWKADEIANIDAYN